MATKQEDKPYLEKPFSVKETTKEQMIYGGGDTITEINRATEEKKKVLLNEG